MVAARRPAPVPKEWGYFRCIAQETVAAHITPTPIPEAFNCVTPCMAKACGIASDFGGCALMGLQTLVQRQSQRA
jgi:hypothetical protein